MTQLRRHEDEIKAKGAGLAAIGMGVPEMAAHFRDEADITFPLLVDRTKETYRALELGKTTLWKLVNPGTLLKGAKSILTGSKQGIPQQDPYQLGGLAVIRPGGDVTYVHRSKSPDDNPPYEKVLSALT